MSLRKRIAAAGLLILGWAVAGSAYAVTPANTQLTNQAKLTYGTGTPTEITAEVTVTVSLITANVTINPTFSNPPDQTKPENSTATITYKVYAQNNGEDTYTIAGSVTGSNNVTAPGTVTPSVGSITLGATALSVATPGSGSITSVSVPSDGTADSVVNGLQAGDTVVIGAVEYTIATVTDPGTGNATITFTGTIPNSLPVGEGIFESKTFTVSIDDVGSKTNPLTPAADITITTTVDNGVDAAFADPVDIDIVQVTVTKLVRCISLCDETAGTGAVSYDSGSGANNYFDGGVTAQPNGILEYLIIMSNPSGGDIDTAFLTDTLPLYTSYVATTTILNQVSVNDAGGAPIFPLDLANGGLTVGDTVGRTAGTEDDGIIGAGQAARVVYRVQVAN